MTGEMQARVLDCGLHTLTTLLHSGIRQSHNGDTGQTVGVIDFHFNDDAFKTHYSAGVNSGEHGFILHDVLTL